MQLLDGKEKMRLNIPKKRNETQQKLDITPTTSADSSKEDSADPNLRAADSIEAESSGSAQDRLVRTRDDAESFVKNIIRKASIDQYFGRKPGNYSSRGATLLDKVTAEVSEHEDAASLAKPLEDDTEISDEVTPEFIQWFSDHCKEACISVRDTHSTIIDDQITLIPLEDLEADTTAADMLKRGREVGFRFDGKPGVVQIVKGRVVARPLYASFLSDRDRSILPKFVTERVREFLKKSLSTGFGTTREEGRVRAQLIISGEVEPHGFGNES